MNQSERDLLRAAMDRIFPQDEMPGATDLGADQYLIELLVREPRYASIYGDGLAELGRTGFLELDVEAQERVLTSIDPSFLQILIQHTMEGAFCDPTNNGGNRDRLAWRMIGFEVTA